MSKSPDEVLASIAESSRNVKFGTGVVSKTTYVAALIPAIWGGVIWKLSDQLLMNVALIFSAFIATGFAMWYIRGSQNFAEKNPAQALLDGAELLEWRRIEAASSALPLPPPDQPMGELPPARKVGE